MKRKSAGGDPLRFKMQRPPAACSATRSGTYVQEDIHERKLFIPYRY